MNEDVDLTNRTCRPCNRNIPPLTNESIEIRLKLIDGWSFEDGEVVRTYTFTNYLETMSFVNALAWIAHSQDHHPNIEVGYTTCKVRYTTHAISGISENDFICAAKINLLVN